jgi:hypothetical protein
MEKTTLGLIAALGAAAVPSVAGASTPATDRIFSPSSLADLLDPVDDPVATLDALQAQGQLGPAKVSDERVAEATLIVRHHHHHHHHVVIVRHRHHHHHHHQTVIIHRD